MSEVISTREFKPTPPPAPEIIELPDGSIGNRTLDRLLQQTVEQHGRKVFEMERLSDCRWRWRNKFTQEEF